MLTQLFAFVAFMAGIGAIGFSFTAETLTGEHVAVLAVAAFTFAGAAGIWHISHQIESYLKDK